MIWALERKSNFLTENYFTTGFSDFFSPSDTKLQSDNYDNDLNNAVWNATAAHIFRNMRLKRYKNWDLVLFQPFIWKTEWWRKSSHSRVCAAGTVQEKTQKKFSAPRENADYSEDKKMYHVISPLEGTFANAAEVVSRYHRLDTGQALTLGQQLNSWKLWLNHFGMSWCSSLSGGVRPNSATPEPRIPHTSKTPCLRREWLCLSSEKWFFRSLVKGSVSFEREDHSCRGIFHTSPSVQSSMIIQTGFSVITPMSFTMWGWSNWRIVTKRKRNKPVCYRKPFLKKIKIIKSIKKLWPENTITVLQDLKQLAARKKCLVTWCSVGSTKHRSLQQTAVDSRSLVGFSGSSATTERNRSQRNDLPIQSTTN